MQRSVSHRNITYLWQGVVVLSIPHLKWKTLKKTKQITIKVPLLNNNKIKCANNVNNEHLNNQIAKTNSYGTSQILSIR